MSRGLFAGLCPFILLLLAPGQAIAASAANGLAPRVAEAGQLSEYCARLMDVTTKAACRDANNRIHDLPTGTGRLAPPHLVYRDNEVTVYFELTRAGARSRLEEGTAARTDNVPLAAVMSAVLVGEGFRISPATPPGGQNGGPPRAFGPGDNVMWRWNVVAFDAPSHNLRIEVYVHIPVKNKDGSDGYSINPALIRSVELPVRRTWSQVVDDLGTWVARSTTGVKLLTGLVVAVGALLTAWFALPGFRRRVKARRARKRRPSPPRRAPARAQAAAPEDASGPPAAPAR